MLEPKEVLTRLHDLAEETQGVCFRAIIEAMSMIEDSYDPYENIYN